MRRKRAQPKNPRPTFAFVVDGECEVWYLQMLKRNERALHIAIEPKIAQKKSIPDQYEMVKALSVEYSKVFWIIDLDTVIQETRKARKGDQTTIQTFEFCRRELTRNWPNVSLIVNSPCLEFWFLLHFEFTTKYFPACGNVQKLLRKNIENYEKTQAFYTRQHQDIYLLLKEHLETAIANSKRGGAFQAMKPEIGLSEMYLFFDADEFHGYFTGKEKNHLKGS